MTSSTSLLIVDDDPPIRELLSQYLSEFGFMVDTASDGATMRTKMLHNSFQLIILDLMLPKEDGLSLCKALRTSHPNLPIIMLTARGEIADRVVGLELGADDYIVKPFEPRELVARIRALLRRTSQSNHPTSAEAPISFADDKLCFEGWTLDRNIRQIISPDNLVIPLSNAEFRLLWAFIERPKRIINRDDLMDAVRGRFADAFDRSIDLLVSRLRQKLGDDPKNPTLLKTIRGEGYLFDAKITRP